MSCHMSCMSPLVKIIRFMLPVTILRTLPLVTGSSVYAVGKTDSCKNEGNHKAPSQTFIDRPSENHFDVYIQKIYPFIFTIHFV